MHALYAFSRCTDDLGDSFEPAERRREQLDAWRESLGAACDGRFDGPVWPGLLDTVERFNVPIDYLYAIVDGVAMDLEPPCYETFDDLRRYCFHVASAVGLACIHIWGCTDERATELADACGVAFQMTNILRDLREDATRERIYLPRAELARFNCEASDLQASVLNERLAAMLRCQIERTERLYEEAAPLASMIPPRSRHAFVAMFGTYRRLLAEIKQRDGDVFSRRVRLSSWRRLGILCSALIGPLSPCERIRVRGACKSLCPSGGNSRGELAPQQPSLQPSPEGRGSQGAQQPHRQTGS